MDQGSMHFVRARIRGTAIRKSDGGIAQPGEQPRVLHGIQVVCKPPGELLDVLDYDNAAGGQKTTQNNVGRGQTLLDAYFLFTARERSTVSCQVFLLAEDIRYGTPDDPSTPVNEAATDADLHTIRFTSGVLEVTGPPQPDAREALIAERRDLTSQAGEISLTEFQWTAVRKNVEVRLGIQLTNCVADDNHCDVAGSLTGNAWATTKLQLTNANPSCTRTYSDQDKIPAAEHHLKIHRTLAFPWTGCSPTFTVKATLSVSSAGNPVTLHGVGWSTLVARSCDAWAGEPVPTPRCSGG